MPFVTRYPLTASARAWLSAMFDVRLPELSVCPMISTVRLDIFASAPAIWSRIARPCGVSVALPVSNSIVRFASVWSSRPCSDALTRSPFLIV
ncbi:ompA/MotB domain protein [Burkholderia pseudomallei MSHR7500]|nr:ompA/MotB domain protein [Burkholderia pseudomallei MSHR7500]VBS64515.1 Uncharacterised protein [Burkholderia pseudomallei]